MQMRKRCHVAKFKRRFFTRVSSQRSFTNQTISVTHLYRRLNPIQGRRREYIKLDQQSPSFINAFGSLALPFILLPKQNQFLQNFCFCFLRLNCCSTDITLHDCAVKCRMKQLGPFIGCLYHSLWLLRFNLKFLRIFATT